MDDIAVFKLDSLPDITFTVTRTTQPAPMPSGGTKPIGFLDFVGRREFVPGIASQAGVLGPTGPEMVETPRIPGGKVPFVFRTLPGYTFYAIRFDHEILDKDLRGGTERRAPGWIRVTYYGPGDDEERELCGFAGPQS